MENETPESHRLHTMPFNLTLQLHRLSVRTPVCQYPKLRTPVRRIFTAAPGVVAETSLSMAGSLHVVN